MQPIKRVIQDKNNVEPLPPLPKAEAIPVQKGAVAALRARFEKSNVITEEEINKILKSQSHSARQKEYLLDVQRKIQHIKMPAEENVLKPLQQASVLGKLHKIEVIENKIAHNKEMLSILRENRDRLESNYEQASRALKLIGESKITTSDEETIARKLLDVTGRVIAQYPREHAQYNGRIADLSQQQAQLLKTLDGIR